MALAPQGQARGWAGHTPHPTHCPGAPLPHTRWSCASLTHVYCFIANRAVTKREEGPHVQGRARAGACTDESPRPQGEPRSWGCGAQGPPWSSSKGSGSSPLFPGCQGPGPRPGVKTDQGKPCTQPQIHLLPFQICSVAHRGSHPSPVSPWAQRHPSSQRKDWGLRLPAAEKM